MNYRVKDVGLNMKKMKLHVCGWNVYNVLYITTYAN